VELFGESYSRSFPTPHGMIGVMADIYASGEILELRDLIIYPIGKEAISVGPREVLSIRQQVEAEVRDMGYLELRITADRITGANPGKHVDLRRKL